MRASNKDVLEYSFYGKPAVNILETNKYDKYFEVSRQYSGSKDLFERGWIYAAIGTRELSAFITLGFDEKQRVLFNEIRYKDKIYPLGEGFCNDSTTFKKDGITISDSLRELEWKGNNPNCEITLTVKTPDPTKPQGELLFRYQFQEHSSDIGRYKCVFKEFDKIIAYWMISPAKAKLTVESKGDITQFNLGVAEEIIGKTFTSDFGYAENIHMLLPMIAEGWNWTIIGCFKNPQDQEPKIFVSYMEEFFYTPQKQGENPKTPIFTQLYVIDIETKESRLYNDATSKIIRQQDGSPLLKISSPSGVEIDLVPKNASQLNNHKIRGIKLYNILPKTDYDYTTFPSVAKVKIAEKEYEAIGTSEITGADKIGYWI